MWRTNIYSLKHHQSVYMTARRSVTLTFKKPMQRRVVTEHHVNDSSSSSSLTSMLGHSSNSKRGLQVTWIGLISNVGLTVSKGTAGWLMNSASLLADATHSLSDLLSDFVTLYTFKMSRKVPDTLYPYGYGKYETIGSFSVSGLLIAGGFGIGIHSFDLLWSTLQSGQEGQQQEVLDPNAAWFALGSVLVKEWLYRITLKVGKSERSDVLIANAWHHRSDAYSSFVALIAIGGTYMGIPIFDPLGGLVVSFMILKSGTDIMRHSIKELTDQQSLTVYELQEINGILNTIKNKELQEIIDFDCLRGRKCGPSHQVNVKVYLDPTLSLYRANEIEKRIQYAIQQQCPYVQQVMIHLESNLSDVKPETNKLLSK